jgi:hypothetical protein
MAAVVVAVSLFVVTAALTVAVLVMLLSLFTVCELSFLFSTLIISFHRAELFNVTPYGDYLVPQLAIP